MARTVKAMENQTAFQTNYDKSPSLRAYHELYIHSSVTDDDGHL